MKKYRKFDLLREEIDEVPGLEKWSLKLLENPIDPSATKVSAIKVLSMRQVYGEFRLENAILSVTQDLVIGKPPGAIRFSLQLEGIDGDAILYNTGSARLALLSGDVGSPEGKMYELSSPAGAPNALFGWLEDLSQNTYW